MATPDWSNVRNDLEALHGAALAAADPARAVRHHLRFDGERLTAGDHVETIAAGSNLKLVAFGKASLRMARAALEVLGDRLDRGVVSYYKGLEPGQGWPAQLELIPAAHPIPDAGSLEAGEAVLRLVANGHAGDRVLVLVSGGGSALLEALRPGIEIADLQSLTTALQRSGADIVELNTVRRSLSRIKGGGLAAAARPAQVIALLLSDVVGDPIASIASGPTVPSPTGPADALEVIERRKPSGDHGRVIEALRQAVASAASAETKAPAPFAIHVLVGSNRQAAEALAAEARHRGFAATILTDRMQGEAREVGRMIGGLAASVRASGLPHPAPACLVLGGETTVTVRGRGRGGRNQETALGAAFAIAGCPRVAVLSFGTDGIDGPTEAAGAVALPDTLARARELGLSPHDALENNDAEPFFRSLGDLWVTGPTGTNVNDLVVVVAYP